MQSAPIHWTLIKGWLGVCVCVWGGGVCEIKYNSYFKGSQRWACVLTFVESRLLCSRISLKKIWSFRWKTKQGVLTFSPQLWTRAVMICDTGTQMGHKLLTDGYPSMSTRQEKNVNLLKQVIDEVTEINPEVKLVFLHCTTNHVVSCKSVLNINCSWCN